MATTKVSGELVDLNEATSESGLKIPKGTVLNRPATGVAGMIRNNTSETSESSASCEEYYNGTAWQKLNNVALPPEKMFQTINWTGTAAEQTISFANSPDLVIIKNMDENSNTDPWYWFDSTRGATKYLQSASDAAEGTDAQTLKSFTSTGFVLGTNDAVNGSGHNTYGIGFRVNGGVTSSNTDGTITSTVQVNNQTGMSIVQWTGDGNGSATVGHGLSSAPTLIILKDTSNTRNWMVYAEAAEAGYKYGGNLDLTSGFNASAGTNGAFNDPTSSVIRFSVGSSSINNCNASGASIIAYCFVETSNYFASRRYTGSGSSGSPSINFGFKPDFVIIKSITQAEQWWTGMSATNSSDQWTKWMPLQSNERLQTDTAYSITADANGFSPYGTPPLNNQSGVGYLALGFKINS